MSTTVMKPATHTRPSHARTALGRPWFLAALGLTVLVSCSSGNAVTAKPQGAAPGSDSTPSVLATIGDENVTMADLRTRAGEPLEQLDGQYRRARDKIIASVLDSMVSERLLTNEVKKRGKSADDLMLAEMGTGPEPTEAEIAAWYKDNPARVGTRTLDQVRPQIAEYLRNDRRHASYAKLLDRLKTENKVSMKFEPWRAEFANQGAPVLGKNSAPVTLVEFSDFQCPYCQAVAPTLKEVTQKFGDQVKIVYRQYPIPSLHPFALKAAEASLCANEQGKFWELHDAMFQDQKKLAVSDLKQTARRLGVDGKKFDNCLDTGRYTEQVQNDMKEGARVGVNGTPAMFINGRYVEGGTVPFSVLEALIKKELAQAKSGN